MVPMTIEILHRSSYSSVFLGAPSGTAPLSCYKVYEKQPLQARHWLNISRECCILSRLQEARVPGVVQLISVADTPQQFSLQFKPCLGGNLYHSIQRRECQDEARLCIKVIIPLLRVLADLHALGVIHRDIKPENIFFESDGRLMLGDFGLAIDSNLDKPCSRVGTTDYMAPEVMAQPSADLMVLRNITRSMLRPYTCAVDIWALGILVHEALTGLTPFSHADQAVMALKAQFGAGRRLPGHISPECQSFVDAVLQKQPGKRPSAAALLQHAWVQKHMSLAAPAAKSVRYACPSGQPVSSDTGLVSIEPSIRSRCCFGGTPANCHAVAGATPAPSAAQHAIGSAPATGVVLVQADGRLKAATSGCTAAYGFNCHTAQQQQQAGSAAGPAATNPRVAMSAFNQRMTVCTLNSRASNSSSSEQPVAKLVLVPALSAPMLLEPSIPAADGRTSQSGTGRQADVAGHGDTAGSINWRMSAAAPAAAKASAAEDPKPRGRSWSPGHPADYVAAARLAAGAGAGAGRGDQAVAAAGAEHDAVVAAAGAMGAPRVPAADACAVAAAAAAGASAAAAGAPTARQQLLSAGHGQHAVGQRLCSFAGKDRRHSAELEAGVEHKAPGAEPGVVPLSRHAQPLGLMRYRARSPLNKDGLQSAIVAASALTWSASQVHAVVLQQVKAPPSPNKACRVMKGMCKKMLHALRQTQPGQAS